MDKIIFSFNSLKIVIDCDIQDNIKKICREFALLIDININKLKFIYNSKEINFNSKIKDYRTMKDDKSKLMNILVEINNKEYFEKINYEFKKNPNIKYISNLSNSKNGSLIFDVFISFKDNNEYIVTKNKNEIDIYLLLDYKKITSLKGHNADIVIVKYYINNKDYKEYLISTDYMKIVIVWDIKNNYNILQRIQTQYKELIYNCLLVFPHNKEDNYISLCANEMECDYLSVLKIFSLSKNVIIKESKNPLMIKNFCILSWHNKNNDEYYIIKMDYGRVQITNLLENEIYSTFVTQNEGIHYDGLIYNKNDKDYLCVSSFNGYLDIWDLYDKILFKSIYIQNCKLNKIIKWNDKYIIITDYENNSFKIIDIENNKAISSINYLNTENILCIKKIYHPIFGESLVYSGNDSIIRLFGCK